MKVPKIANALNYLDDDLISDAIEYRPKKRHFFQWTKWKTVAACLALIAVVAGIFPLFNQPGTSPFVLTAYALEADNSVSASPMVEGEFIPISLFETESGMKVFVFSYGATDPGQIPSHRILDVGNPYSSEVAIGEIAGLKTETGQNYQYVIPEQSSIVPCSFPMVIHNDENNMVYVCSMVIEESDSGYIAKLVEITQYERKTNP